MGDSSMGPIWQRKSVVAGGVVAAIVLVGAWLLGSDEHEERLAAVLNDVENLRQFQLKHQELFGEFIGANAAPRTPDAVSPEPVAWTSNPGFDELAWAPAHSEEVWASFSVTLTRPTLDGQGFVIRAYCDLDGDGETARFEASQDQPATRVSSSGVH